MAEIDSATFVWLREAEEVACDEKILASWRINLRGGSDVCEIFYQWVLSNRLYFSVFPLLQSNLRFDKK